MELSNDSFKDAGLTNTKSFDQLTPIEKQQFLDHAIAERDKFLAWVTNHESLSSKNKDTIFDKWNYAPSKKLLLAAATTVGLANIGFPLAAERFHIDFVSIMYPYLSVIGPIMEELVFRSKKIPHFISFIGNRIGMNVRPDHARLATNVTFAATHLWNTTDLKPRNILSSLNAFGLGGAFQKAAHEKGISASIALHALWNATIAGLHFLVLNEDDESLVKSMLNNKTKFDRLKTIYQVTEIAAALGVGIVGLREMIDDKQIHDLIDKLRKSPTGKELTNSNQLLITAKKLLKMPSTDGYKFQAGVELAYTNAAITMPDMLKDIITPDEYARTQVHKMVTEVWKDPTTLPHRLNKANRYITEQIAARNPKLYDGTRSNK